MREETIDEAVRVLRVGGVVACATETFVGLLADVSNAGAVERVLELKGRPEGQPMGLLCPHVSSARSMAQRWPSQAEALAQAHWPGPLTLIVEACPGLHEALLKDGKVAIRVPGASPALVLTQRFAGPLTATSANRSGEPAATSADEARRIFGEAVFCVDAEAPGGLPSTILDATCEPPNLVRPGAVVL